MTPHAMRRQGPLPYHLVDTSTAAVLAVKGNVKAARRSADNISRRYHGKPVAIWLMDRMLRPGTRITGTAGTFVAEIGFGRWSRR